LVFSTPQSCLHEETTDGDANVAGKGTGEIERGIGIGIEIEIGAETDAVMMGTDGAIAGVGPIVQDEETRIVTGDMVGIFVVLCVCLDALMLR